MPGTVENSLDPLTPREREVLTLIASGSATKQVATALRISFKTAACHRSRIMAKLSAHNAADLTRAAMHMGLIGLRQDGREAAGDNGFSQDFFVTAMNKMRSNHALARELQASAARMQRTLAHLVQEFQNLMTM